jgi:hypothetical protein
MTHDSGVTGTRIVELAGLVEGLIVRYFCVPIAGDELFLRCNVSLYDLSEMIQDEPYDGSGDGEHSA